MTAAENILGCSRTTSKTVLLKAELGSHPLQTNRAVRKLKRQYQPRSMPKDRLPAMADRAVWEKATKGQAGRWWDNVIDKVWEETKRDTAVHG